MLKKSKSIIALFLAFVMILMVSGSAFAATTDTKGHWAEKQISAWLDKGLAAGYQDGTFKPDQSITRAEFITLINRAFDFKIIKTSDYLDVKSSNWFYEEIAKANAAGYIVGYKDGTMRPDNKITRQEVAVILARILKLNVIDSTDAIKDFSDLNTMPAWSRASINAIVANAYMKGYPDKTFKPIQNITRAEAITTIDPAITKTVLSSGGGGGSSNSSPSVISILNAAGGIYSGNYTVSSSMTIGPSSGRSTINGTLTLDPGPNGEVKLQNITATNIVVLSGASSSIVLNGVNVTETLTVNAGSQTNSVHIVTENGTHIGHTVVQSKAIIESFQDCVCGDINLGVGTSGQIVEFRGTFTDTVIVDSDVKNVALLINANLEKLDVLGSVVLQGDNAKIEAIGEVSAGTGAIISYDESVTSAIYLLSAKIQTEVATAIQALNVTKETLTYAKIQPLRNVLSLARTISAIDAAYNISNITGYSDLNAMEPDVNNFLAAYDAVAITYFTGDNALRITGNLALPTSGAHGTTITWASDKTKNITALGAVYRPENTEDNQEVKLTATVQMASPYSALKNSKVIYVTVIAISGARVDLGMAGNYAILAKAGISSVPNSVITGNIGVSPAAATFITGFSLTADATNVFSTSTQIIGKAYAANYTSPTPSNLTTAVSDMETAYTDAAGRAADYTELHTGDISGKTLTPGVYKWSTGILINSDLTLSGGANAVWIFQIAKGITQAANIKIILAGGAQAKNIFWQAAETVEIGTGAHFEGNVLGMKNITLGTKASINGRLLAQTAVTLDQSTVVAP